MKDSRNIVLKYVMMVFFDRNGAVVQDHCKRTGLHMQQHISKTNLCHITPGGGISTFYLKDKKKKV